MLVFLRAFLLFFVWSFTTEIFFFKCHTTQSYYIPNLTNSHIRRNIITLRLRNKFRTTAVSSSDVQLMYTSDESLTVRNILHNFSFLLCLLKT